mmetsp:Transcript_43683/g.127127  ORF Transcript_43683/g.127127 Transcript_43683/m.127127 type:complete len:468 (-) Transcript_43683:195-1598(-)
MPNVSADDTPAPPKEAQPKASEAVAAATTASPAPGGDAARTPPRASNASAGVVNASAGSFTGLDLHEALALYIGALILLLLVYIGVLWFCRRFSKNGNTRQEGLFVMSSWPVLLRGIVTAFMTTFILLPLVLAVATFLLAPLYCAAEGWTYYASLDYVLSNLGGLLRPLTKAKPATFEGQLMDVGLSLVQFILTQIITGLAAALSLFRTVKDGLPSSWWGLFSWAVIVLPLIMLALVVASGHILALIEGWPEQVGVMYMASSMLGMCAPLTQDSPDSVAGKVFDIASIVVELSAGGALIGTICAHTKMVGVIALIEGDGDGDGDGATTDNAAGTAAKTADARLRKANPDIPLQDLVRIEAEELRRLQNLVVQQEWRLSHLREEMLRGERGGYEARTYTGGQANTYNGGDPYSRSRWGDLPEGDPFLPLAKPGGRTQNGFPGYGGRGPTATMPILHDESDSDDGGVLC